MLLNGVVGTEKAIHEPMSWKTRLSIALDAAQGDYTHRNKFTHIMNWSYFLDLKFPELFSNKMASIHDIVNAKCIL